MPYSKFLIACNCPQAKHLPSPMTSSSPQDSRVNAIMRKHAHDVRNYVNCLDLDASFLEELVADPEAVTTVQRMRGQLRQLDLVVKSLSVKFAEPRPVTITAADLLQLWQHQVTVFDGSSGSIAWLAPTELKVVTLDPGVIVIVLRELTMEAATRCRSVKAGVRTSADEVTAYIEEAGKGVPSDELGERLLLVAANGGRLHRAHDVVAGIWVTSLSFPVVADVN
jgi:hypothetical protein